MRGRNSESTPRMTSWFALCAMTVFLGLVLNTVGACGPPASNDGAVTDGGTDTPTAEASPDGTVNKPEEAASTPEEAVVTKEDGTDKAPPEVTPETPADETKAKGSGEITKAKATATNTRAPLDASPSPDGKLIYYTAYKAAAAQLPGKSSRDANKDAAKNKDPFGQNNDKQDGVLYSVPATGGTPKALATGFWSPTGLVVSKDGSTIYVADSNASDTLNPDKVGAIYSVSSSGGAKTLLSGTSGYKPKSLDIVKEATDEIYFTGTDVTTGKVGVFKVSAGGGSVSTIYTPGASDEFFKDPGGLAVTAARTIYVAETIGGMGGNSSSVVKIKGGKATEFVTGIKVGYPAGIALSHDEKFILVSGIDPNRSTSVVYRINLSDPKKMQKIGKGTSIENKTSSAGLHRAHNADIFAWADAAWPDETGKNGGTVFLLNTKANP